jgi:hypothetical protein
MIKLTIMCSMKAFGTISFSIQIISNYFNYLYTHKEILVLMQHKSSC